MNFDRLAPHYDWMEAVCGGSLQRARTAWLEELSDCRRILSAGEGHGRFAAACARRFPAAELTCVEASPRMLARAQARTRGLPGAPVFHCADVRTWTPAATYDAVVTCFFLDCFPPGMLDAVVARLAECASPRAKWLVVDFSLPARGPARWRARAIHRLMYAFFRHTAGLPARRLTRPDPFLAAHGFRRTHRQEFECGLLAAELWQRG